MGKFTYRTCAILLLLLMILSAVSLGGCKKDEETAISCALLPVESETDAPALMALIDPASEVRGVFIASVYNIDFPTKADLSAAALKKEIDSILDTMEEAGLNTVYFQVRPACDALYKSDIFPVSRALSTNGKLVMDPLSYMVEQAHRRNIFVHAWVNPLRVSTGSEAKPNVNVADLPDGSPVKEHPEWAVAYADGRLYLNPGIPEVRQLIADGVKEIVAGYDVDGVIFDDYFYPYPVTLSDGTVAIFNDDDSFAQYGGSMSRADWRRDNVNQMVKGCYDAVKSVSADVQFGVAPFGIWKNDDGKNGGSATRGMQSYFSIYCDPVAWAEGGYVDYLAPQIYWRFTTEVAPFAELTRWWNRVLDGTGVDLLVSHAAYNYDVWSSPEGEIAEQITFARSELTYRGSIFYGYDEIRRNAFSLRDELQEAYGSTIIYVDPSPTGETPSVSSPPSGTYVNASGTYLIGSSSPDKPLTLNGRKVSRTRGGYFSVYVDLAKGENTFVLEQDGVRYTHTVYGGTAPTSMRAPADTPMDKFSVTNVSPARDVLQNGGSTLKITCTAPAGSVVTAYLGNLSVRLKQTETKPSAKDKWMPASFAGQITLPTCSAEEIRAAGEVFVLAKSGQHEASAIGGSVRVKGADALIPVRVTKDHTELKLGLDSDYYGDFSVQSAGMTDYARWQGNGMYLLRVGGYVYEDSVEELPSDTDIPIGKLGAIGVNSDGDNTCISVSVDQNVPHNGTVRNGAFELTLYNVDVSTVPKEITVADNPLITDVRITYPNKANCVRLVCTLVDAKNFYGFDFEYENGGVRAVLPNPKDLSLDSDKPLTGIRIVLDAGHGGTDSGALGAQYTDRMSVHEKDLNLSVTLAVKGKLEELGAEVLLTREDDRTVPLSARASYLCDVSPDLSISIHQNSMDYSVDVTRVRGSLCLWWADSGVLLAECMSGAVADSLNRNERAPAQQKLMMCRNPKFPSVLIEVGFMTSVEEYEYMLNGGITAAAEGITSGVIEYFAAQKQWYMPQ